MGKEPLTCATEKTPGNIDRWKACPPGDAKPGLLRNGLVADPIDRVYSNNLEWIGEPAGVLMDLGIISTSRK
jgi:hypothetical protein